MLCCVGAAPSSPRDWPARQTPLRAALVALTSALVMRDDAARASSANVDWFGRAPPAPPLPLRHAPALDFECHPPPPSTIVGGRVALVVVVVVVVVAFGGANGRKVPGSRSPRATAAATSAGICLCAAATHISARRSQRCCAHARAQEARRRVVGIVARRGVGGVCGACTSESVFV